MKRTIVFLLALTAWAYPLHAASALSAEPQEEAIFINYQAIHERQANSKKPIVSKKAGTVSQTQDYTGRHYSKEEVIQLIKQYSQQYRIDPATPLCIAQKESGYNQFSANKSSSARGVFQYLSGTWIATDEGKAGLSVFDADANVRAAVKYMGIHKNTRPWVVAPNCPSLKFIN